MHVKFNYSVFYIHSQKHAQDTETGNISTIAFRIRIQMATIYWSEYSYPLQNVKFIHTSEGMEW